MKVIELKNIKKTYRLERFNISVLHGINLEIMQGEFVIIMGPSGSGKSTLLNMLGLLDKPTEGSYKLAGVEILKYSDDELASLRNQYLGFIFQQFNLLPKLTILENVALPTIYLDAKDEKYHEDPLKLLNIMGLSERIHHKPSKISGGQQQKVAIARSLVNNPLIIFADEPTGNLDTKSTMEIIKILKDLNNSGITIVMVTHEPELAVYATRMIKVQDGLIISDEYVMKKYSTIEEELVTVFKRKSFSLSRLKNYFIQAWKSLVGNKTRSILSILGIMIGVASLIIMLAVGTGAKRSVEERVSSLGSNLLIVKSGLAQKSGISSEKDYFLRLKNEDVDDLRENVMGIKFISGYSFGRVQVVANGNNYNTIIEGVSPDYAKLRDSYPSIGRFFSEEEDIEKKKVVLLGEVVIKEIYGDRKFNPIGEYIKINRVDFQVIGILPAKGMEGSYDEDDKVIIPLNTALRRVLATNVLNHIDVQVKDGENMNAVSESIIKRLLFTHRMSPMKTDAVRVINMVEIQKIMSSVARTFSLLLCSIAFISLFVGGIGIMNIMFVSVSERTKEIGLRKAVGANNSDILFQFMIESVFVCCTGGIIGILFGSSVLIIVKFVGWDVITTPFSVILAFCFSGFTGFVFGVWPARKASRLNPIEALRYD
ncbi:MAG: ABC transporter permease [Endomicrobium sp.]|jgi:macrolide transport system ATP-binding/permease protein|nr:ABC transporter permease [Endomicrobium sp.]